MEYVETKDFSNIDDEWGGIDNKILSTVKALNALGIVTDGSCEGHLDHASPVPFVSVFQLDEEYNLLEKETSIMFNKLRELLRDFYINNNDVDANVRIILEEPAFIYNGGALWNKWRDEVKTRSLIQNEGGTPVRPILSDDDIAERKLILPKLQEEFAKFAKFLESKIDN